MHFYRLVIFQKVFMLIYCANVFVNINQYKVVIRERKIYSHMKAV